MAVCTDTEGCLPGGQTEILLPAKVLPTFEYEQKSCPLSKQGPRKILCTSELSINDVQNARLHYWRQGCVNVQEKNPRSPGPSLWSLSTNYVHFALIPSLREL